MIKYRPQSKAPALRLGSPGVSHRSELPMTDTSIPKRKECKRCHEEKNLSEFYEAKGCKDGHASLCKVCYRDVRKYNRSKPREVPSIKSEAKAIKHLRRQGIFATPGKMSELRHLDVIAWGCVGIEVKTSRPDEEGKYLFGFTPTQRKRGIRGDFILLVCEGKETTYHLFPSKHPAFYMNGRLKKGFSYDPYQTKRKSGHGMRLTRALMEQFKDRWELIEQRRCEIEHELSTGEKAEYLYRRQLSLFP